ncbi:P-loop containing nucleoside triphosphate hydrolase protein [Kalaharituber pfeilii]|nr:P-loop containing nucleoside triphosphate hydrolase protein [Kalaharituber pfeilii]
MQLRLTDLQHPHEWYPDARSMQRTWIMHVGPTNSGKTYRALKRLEECESGIYAGPLRLLAHEIYERFNAKGISCNLITGEEQRLEHANAKLTSSTVEMVDITRNVEVAVLDEIQMIGDRHRGWAWTQALLAVRAREIHMCGEERTVELIQNLAALTGDKLIVNRYNRLGPLHTANESLEGDWSQIQKGDCVVTFSRKDIFAIKKIIEETTGKRCAVVYGGLPPETRSHQAKLFNDQSNEYDVLVASDAVGMGLNLSIQRVIFETMTKYDGESLKALEVPHIKQIGGRAGRYRVAPSLPIKPPSDQPKVLEAPKSSEASKGSEEIPAVIPPVGPLPAMPNPGIVTTLEKADLRLLKYAMKTDVPPIKTAGILPPDRTLEKFAKTFPPRKPFSQVLEKLFNMAKVNTNLFHLCSVDELEHAAGIVETTKGLTVPERITITQAPVPRRDQNVKKSLVEYSQLIAESKSGSILDVDGLDLEVLDEYLEEKELEANGSAGKQGPKPQDLWTNPGGLRESNLLTLPRLESLHKSTMLWLWLSYRFPAVFTPRETAFDLKQMTEDAIQDILSKTNYNRIQKLKKRKKAERSGAFGEFADVLAEEGMTGNPWAEEHRRQISAAA